VFFFEIATWFETARFEQTLVRAEWPFFAFDIALVAVVLCVTYLKWFERNWRIVAMAFCFILIASRTMSAIAANRDEPLVLALFVLALGATVLVPWSVQWQSVLTLASLIAFTIAALDGVVEPNEIQRWLVLAATMAFAMSFTALKDHYRSQALLIEELLDKEKRLDKNQAVLRTVFDAVPDILTLTRFCDGKLLEVNDEFLRRSRLSREQALATSVVKASFWVRPEERVAYVQRLKKEGRVRNLEVDFRFHGVVAPYLMSSVVVEVDGELQALNVAHDATQIKENERALREAQERLSAQVEELTATQARLRRSEALMRQLFDAVPDMVTLTRLRDGKLIEVNEEFLRATGFGREKALSSLMPELGVWACPEDRQRLVEQLSADGRVRNLEIDFRLRGIVTPHFLSTVTVDFDGELCILGVAYDATSIKKNEHALREAQERLSVQVQELTATQARLRAEVAEREAAERVARERETTVRKVFEASPDIITVSSRRDFRLIQANNAFFHETGYAPQEVIGQQIYLKFWTDPVQREQLKQRLDRDGFVHNMEADLTMKDGTVNSYLLSTVVVELDGEPCRVSFWRNVTEAKRTAQRIADSEAMLRSMFDATPDIIITRRANGPIIDVNEEFVKRTGITREQALATSMDDIPLFLRNEDRAEFLRRIQTDGLVKNFEADFTLKGVAVPYLVSGATVESESGPIIFGISRDIAARKQMEGELVAAREAALAASQAKSEFLSSMSHEIRTPMNAILGMADLLSDGPLGGEQRHYVDTMRSNGNALLRLINDILDVAKIESGRLSFESASFDLEDLVSKAVETVSVRAHTKGLELTARILPHVPLNLIGDPLRLRQILINLASNAIKFTEQGEVALTVESLSPAEALRLGFLASAADGNDGQPSAPAAWLRFSVADTGIGIAADQLGAIFTDFTQADASISRRFGGSGLGLTIVRRLSELMGGRVEVESEVGRGSTFRVTVALGVDSRPAAAAVRGAAPGLDGVRILVVDDNKTNRLILREMLVRSRAEVTEADSGVAALAELGRARAAGRPYRLMLLDYRMPGMDGVEVARKAIADGFTRTATGIQDTIILMLTSDDLNFRLARMHEAGLHTYLIKPIKRVELLETIGNLLSGRNDAAEPRPTPDGQDATPADTRPLRILLAEDAADNRFLIQAYFKKLPYQIELAENGRIAIDKFKASPPDLVLMDVQMPEVDGLTATRAIRQWEAERGLPPTPIIVLTASAQEDDVKRSLAAGCDAHVSKPVKKPALLAAIRKAMAMRPAARAALEPLAAAADSEPSPEPASAPI
jgi:PAS domain S-box-containing protein